MDPAFLIRTDPVLGRHLVASRQLSPGTLVLQQQPYAAVLYDDQVPLRCDYCFRSASGGQPLLRCARSKQARYCSRGHQAAAWRERGYQNECRALLACDEQRRQRGRGGGVPTATVRLAARALWRRIRWGRGVIQCMLHTPLRGMHEPETAPIAVFPCIDAHASVLCGC